MKFPHLLVWILFLVFLTLPASAWAQKGGSETAPRKGSSAPGGKAQGYMGDPALKRGFELGYDLGVKAGKVDKAEKRKANPGQHPDYKAAEKKHRSEYGSLPSFVRGYQMGFTRGYTVAYTGKAAPLKAPSMGAVPSSTEAPPSSTKTKRYDPSEDALRLKTSF